jgi:hypothetical protein
MVILALNVSWTQAHAFTDDLTDCLSNRPLAVGYTYTLSGSGFENVTSGKLILAENNVFRVNLWDKVYSSDGSNLYLHDMNTRQTLIDSLRWPDLNIWIRILQGEIPDQTTITLVDSLTAGIAYKLSNSEPWWEANITVETNDRCIRSLTITDSNGYTHQVDLERPVNQQITAADSLFTLLDLSGTRLDLRY